MRKHEEAREWTRATVGFRDSLHAGMLCCPLSYLHLNNIELGGIFTCSYEVFSYIIELSIIHIYIIVGFNV